MRGFDELRQDVVYGARLLLKSPGFTLAAVVSLALGIGANTAIFSLIHTVLLKLLPVKNPRQLVALTDPSASGVSIGTSSGERGILSTREFQALRDRARCFSGVFASQSQLDTNNALIDGKAPEEVKTRLVSGEYFTVLGARVALDSRVRVARPTSPLSAWRSPILWEKVSTPPPIFGFRSICSRSSCPDACGSKTTPATSPKK